MSIGSNLADDLAAAVLDRCRRRAASSGWPSRPRKAATAGPTARAAPSSTFSATPSPSGPAAHSSPSAPPLAIQPGRDRISIVSGAPGPRISAGCARIAAATRGAAVELARSARTRSAIRSSGSAKVTTPQPSIAVGISLLAAGRPPRPPRPASPAAPGGRAAGSRASPSRCARQSASIPACFPEQLCRSALGRLALGAALELVLAGRAPWRAATRTASSCSGRPDGRRDAIASSRSSRSGLARTTGSAWIGFADERMKVTSPPSPASATTAPSRTATAWTVWRASTMSPRRTATVIGSAMASLESLVPEFPEMEAWRRQLDDPVSAVPDREGRARRTSRR